MHQSHAVSTDCPLLQ